MWNLKCANIIFLHTYLFASKKDVFNCLQEINTELHVLNHIVRLYSHVTVTQNKFSIEKYFCWPGQQQKLNARKFLTMNYLNNNYFNLTLTL